MNAMLNGLHRHFAPRPDCNVISTGTVPRVSLMPILCRPLTRARRVWLRGWVVSPLVLSLENAGVPTRSHVTCQHT